MALSDFNKFIIKLGENISKPVTKQEKDEIERPASPFVVLTSKENDETSSSPAYTCFEENEGETLISSFQFDTSCHSDASYQFDSSNGLSDHDLDESVVHSDLKYDTLEEDDDICKYPSPDTNDCENLYSSAKKEYSFKEDDEQRSYRNNPMTRDQFEKLFDISGRLVNEHDLRKAIFKGGIADDIRKDVWTFLFELYPLNSTARERESIEVEQIVRYEAMKLRWKKLLKNLVNDYEGVRYCPKWYSACPENSHEFTEYYPKFEGITLNNDIEEESAVVVEDVVTQCKQVCLMLPLETGDQDNNEEGGAEKNLSNIELGHIGVFEINNAEEEFKLNDDLVSQPESCNDNLVEDNNALINNDLLIDYNSTNGVELHTINISIECHSSNITKQLCEKNEHSISEIEKQKIKKENNLTRNKLLKQRTVSLNFECDEVDNISEALADAMLDMEVQEKKRISMCNKILPFHDDEDYNNHNSFSDDLNYSARSNHKTDMIQKNLNLEIEYNGDEENISSALKPCNNPFQLPPEYINSQESLYSMSENFKSIDLIEYKHNDNTNIIESCSHNDKSKTFSDSSNHKTIINIEFNVNNLSDHIDILKHDNKNSEDKTICTTHADTLNKQNEPFPNTLIKLPDEINDYDNEVADLTNGILLAVNLPTESHVTSNLDEKPINRSVVKTPTGESLDKLPPWIANMINTSGSKSETTLPNFLSTGNSLIENKSHFSPVSRNQTFKSNIVNNATSSTLSVHNEELLGIVETANKVLQQQIKQHLVSNSPKHSPKHSSKNDKGANKSILLNTDVVSAVDSVPVLQRTDSTPSNNALMSPMSFHESENLFFVDSPKFKFIPNSANTDNSTKDCPYCNFKSDETLSVLLPNSMGEEQLKFMSIQAQVFAARQPYDANLISSSIKVIDKDVPRTDRNLPQFKSDDNPGLLKLRDALLTYAFFHPDVGYAQGMNDIMSRFLVVMDTEADAYWMFVKYMEHFKNDFMEEGMLRKIVLVEQLLMKMDRELCDFLQATDIGLMFCHRWLLLNFKREFDYLEAIRLFEITSSRHLEVSSFEAELERSRERAKDFVKDSAGSHLEEIYMSPEYPFDIFVCVAMLIECRNMIMETSDINSVFQVLSNLPTTLDLQNILRRSEELFYQYCRKSVVDCFQVIDELEIKDFKRKKTQFSFAFR